MFYKAARVLSRHRIFVLATVFLIVLAPLPIAAITNTEVIAIYVESIKGLTTLTKLAYCAAGVSALC